MIRLAKVTDAKAIYQLNLEQLNYDYPVKETAANLARLLADQEHHLLLVYENEQTKQVQGYIHVNLYEETYFKPMYNVMALAVAGSAQQKGIGSKLMAEVEQRAKNSGIDEIRLNSGEERTGAHQFYEKLGYHSSKKQKRFGKKLN